jgi:type II secretory pathway component PulJ
MSTKPPGFSLLEVLVYISLLTVVGLALVGFATRIIRSNSEAQLKAQVLDNARSAMALMTKEIRHANGVYDPTSTLLSHPGQLSLATTFDPPADEQETYVDFYLDDERLYRKREGSAAELITAEKVRVTNLTFTYLQQTLAVPAVQITLTVEPADAASGAADRSTVTLSSTASLRQY